MRPCLGSRKAMEKMPAEPGPWVIGVLTTCQVWPRSAEWKTRADLPPVANQMLGSLLRMARQVLLAAKAPSPSRAGGSCEGGIGAQDWPSVVTRSWNLSCPESSGIGSPRTMPWVGSQNTMESKKALGLVLVNWRLQCWPASVVW